MAQIWLSGDVHGYLIYDKSTQKSKFIEHFTESVDFCPLSVTDEYVLSFSEHEDLDKYLSEEMLDASDRQKLKTLKDAKEEQNPVIIKYKLK